MFPSITLVCSSFLQCASFEEIPCDVANSSEGDYCPTRCATDSQTVITGQMKKAALVLSFQFSVY